MRKTRKKKKNDMFSLFLPEPFGVLFSEAEKDEDALVAVSSLVYLLKTRKGWSFWWDFPDISGEYCIGIKRSAYSGIKVWSTDAKEDLATYGIFRLVTSALNDEYEGGEETSGIESWDETVLKADLMFFRSPILLAEAVLEKGFPVYKGHLRGLRNT